MSTGNHELNNNFIIVITLFQGGTNLLAIRAKGYTFRPQWLPEESIKLKPEILY